MHRPLRVLPGGDADAFDAPSRQAFFASAWQISPQSDRMGVRLGGEPLRGAPRAWSQGVVEGAIQVPPDGQPIVLMADRQSMGGYPLLGVLHPLDLGRLAQCPAHSEVPFVESDLARQQADLLRVPAVFPRLSAQPARWPSGSGEGALTVLIAKLLRMSLTPGRRSRVSLSRRS